MFGWLIANVVGARSVACRRGAFSTRKRPRQTIQMPLPCPALHPAPTRSEDVQRRRRDSCCGPRLVSR